MNQQLINDYTFQFLKNYYYHLDKISTKQMINIMIHHNHYNKNVFTNDLKTIFHSDSIAMLIYQMYNVESPNLMEKIIFISDENYQKIFDVLWGNLMALSPETIHKLFLEFNATTLNIDPNLSTFLPNNIMIDRPNSLMTLKANMSSLMFLCWYMDYLPKSFNNKYSKYLETISNM